MIHLAKLATSLVTKIVFTLNWSTPKHKSKYKLEKWFIISGDGVRPSVHTYVRTNVRTYEHTYVTYVRTKQNKPIKELNNFSS